MTLTPNEYEIEITADCNAACPLCARTMMDMPLRGNDFISFEDFKKIFPDKSSIEDKKFKFVGVLGDPILNQDLISILKYLHLNNAKYSLLNTNGSYNNVDWWEELASIPKLMVEFSVDGHRETNHLYRINTKWENIERNMTVFMSAGGTGTWAFLSFEHNDVEYETAREHAAKLGMLFERKTSGRILSIPTVTKDIVSKKTKGVKTLSFAESNAYKHNDADKIKDTVRSAVKRDTEKLNAIAKTITCKHFEKPSVYIGADMTLWPCCYLYDEYKWIQSNSNTRRQAQNPGLTNLPDGFNDLRIHSITEILNSEFYRNLQDRWNAESDNFIFRCVKSCGNNAAYHNHYTKIDKSSK